MTPREPAELTALRERIGAVIDRWYHLGLIRFNSRDDGGDDLILRDELVAAAHHPDVPGRREVEATRAKAMWWCSAHQVAHSANLLMGEHIAAAYNRTSEPCYDQHTAGIDEHWHHPDVRTQGAG